MSRVIEILDKGYLGYYSKTRTACRAIIVEDNKILMSYETTTNKYMTPGGGKEDNETDLECVVRELKEETGYIVKPIECLLEIHEYYSNERYIGKYFLCKIVSKGENSLTELERSLGMGPKWVPIKEILDIFSKYLDYKERDARRSGLYLREYTALINCLKKYEEIN